MVPIYIENKAGYELQLLWFNISLTSASALLVFTFSSINKKEFIIKQNLFSTHLAVFNYISKHSCKFLVQFNHAQGHYLQNARWFSKMNKVQNFLCSFLHQSQRVALEQKRTLSIYLLYFTDILKRNFLISLPGINKKYEAKVRLNFSLLSSWESLLQKEKLANLCK